MAKKRSARNHEAKRKDDPFALPEFYNTPRTPTAEPVMPIEVYYNKLAEEDETPGETRS